MLCAMNPSVTDWITAFASVLAAGGTIGAVVLSLCLVQRGQRPRITVHCHSGIRVIPRSFVMAGGPTDNVAVINLRATNEGARTVTLSEVYVRTENGFAVAVLDPSVRQHFPKVLQPGENLTVGWPRGQIAEETGFAEDRFYVAYFMDTVGRPYSAPYPGVKVVRRLCGRPLRKAYRLPNGVTIPMRRDRT